MAKIKDDCELMDTQRAAVMRSAATILENVSKAKALRKKWEAVVGRDEPDAPENPEGDLLFDLLRLHTTYLNEAAKLGERYGALAFRALEKLYETAVPKVTSVTLTPSSPAGPFIVENDVAPTSASPAATREVTLDVPDVPGPKGGRLSLEADGAAIALEKDGSRWRGSLSVQFGKPKTVLVACDFGGYRRLRIRDEIRVALSIGDVTKRMRHVPLLVDNSARPPEVR